jgi:outer membrane protein
MNKFLKFCIGISIVLFGAGFFMRSVQSAMAGPVINNNPEKLLYVNIDSVDANYKAFTDLAKNAGDALSRKQKEYQKKTQSLQLRYDIYQQKVQMHTISADDAVREEAFINAGMEELKTMETDLGVLEQEAMERNAAITLDITEFLQKYAAVRRTDFIFAYGGTTNLLYANSELDITKEVVDHLNAEYEKNHQK